MSRENDKWKRTSRREGRNSRQSTLKKKAIDWSFKSTHTFISKDRFMQPIPQSNTRQNKRARKLQSSRSRHLKKDREWAAKASRVGLLNTYCAQPNCRFWRRHTEISLCLRYKRSQLTLPLLNRLTWPTTWPSNERWEVAADIQTGVQYSSTWIMNAQKHWAMTATSRKTLIVFLKIPTRLKAEAAIA